jgi:OmpA-OmpF porin, OOP family
MHLLDHPFGRSTALVLCVAIGSWLVASYEEPEGRVVVTDTETTILDVVEFEPGTATLRATSQPILDAVAATLEGNPSIELVEVQSHTRGTGDEIANLALSDRRAAAVVAYLVNAGVAPARLEAQGYGDTQPIDRTTPAKNERISFLILKRSSDEQPPP